MIGTWVVLAMMLAQPGGDVLVLRSGARVEGTLVSASPTAGVYLRLPTGEVQWFHPNVVDRIERVGETAPPAREPAVAPPPSEPTRPPEAQRPEEPSTYSPPTDVPAPLPPDAPPAYWPPSAPPPPPPSSSVAPLPPGPTPAPKLIAPLPRRRAPYPPPALIAPPPWQPPRPPRYALAVDPYGARPRTEFWTSFGIGGATALGSSGKDAPALRKLVGPQTMLSFEFGQRLDERESWGLLLDLSLGDPGTGLQPTCDLYGTDCSTGTAMLGLFFRHDVAPRSHLDPWISLGFAREWVNGEVFSPYAGGDSVSVLSAPGWQARLGAGFDIRTSRWFGLGIFGTLSAGTYERVTIDGVDVDGGKALHGWAQLGVRAILGP